MIKDVHEGTDAQKRGVQNQKHGFNTESFSSISEKTDVTSLHRHLQTTMNLSWAATTTIVVLDG